jgi:hypothetical protein
VLVCGEEDSGYSVTIFELTGEFYEMSQVHQIVDLPRKNVTALTYSTSLFVVFFTKDYNDLTYIETVEVHKSETGILTVMVTRKRYFYEQHVHEWASLGLTSDLF